MTTTNYCTCGAPQNAPSTLDFHNPACPRLERYPGETASLRDEIARLRAALKPFADLSGIYVRRAETFDWKDSDGVFGATDVIKDATIRVSDCRAALKALGEEG
jgi:hypothetical protein